MSRVKGAKEYEKFKSGEELSRKEAMLAMCYDCNGEEDSANDCLGTECPLYSFQHYAGKKSKHDSH